jgi:hypothetical protein
LGIIANEDLITNGIDHINFELGPAIIDSTVTPEIDDLILELLEWMGTQRRPYSEVLDAWRTSCPRLPVWEEANEQGFIDRHHVVGEGQFVSVSVIGAEHLRKFRSSVGTTLEPQRT